MALRITFAIDIVFVPLLIEWNLKAITCCNLVEPPKSETQLQLLLLQAVAQPQMLLLSLLFGQGPLCLQKNGTNFWLLCIHRPS